MVDETTSSYKIDVVFFASAANARNTLSYACADIQEVHTVPSP